MADLASRLPGASHQRAVHLLGALANAGPSAAHLADAIAPFVVSMDASVRHQAFLALKEMLPTDASRRAVAAAAEFDLNGRVAMRNGTVSIEKDIDALLDLEDTEKVGLGLDIPIYSWNTRVSGTDQVNLAIHHPTAATTHHRLSTTACPPPPDHHRLTTTA